MALPTFEGGWRGSLAGCQGEEDRGQEDRWSSLPHPVLRWSRAISLKKCDCGGDQGTRASFSPRQHPALVGQPLQRVQCLQMRTGPSAPQWGLPGGRAPCSQLSEEGVLQRSLWREPRIQTILPKGFKPPLPLEGAFHTRQTKDFNPRFKRTRDQKQMLLEDTSACLAVWGHGYGGEDNSSRNPASPIQ